MCCCFDRNNLLKEIFACCFIIINFFLYVFPACSSLSCVYICVFLRLNSHRSITKYTNSIQGDYENGQSKQTKIITILLVSTAHYKLNLNPNRSIAQYLVLNSYFSSLSICFCLAHISKCI